MRELEMQVSGLVAFAAPDSSVQRHTTYPCIVANDYYLHGLDADGETGSRKRKRPPKR